MTTALSFALLDALAGLYLIGYGMLRERRDVAGVIIVGSVLLVCSLSLSVVTLVR